MNILTSILPAWPNGCPCVYFWVLLRKFNEIMHTKFTTESQLMSLPFYFFTYLSYISLIYFLYNIIGTSGTPPSSLPPTIQLFLPFPLGFLLAPGPERSMNLWILWVAYVSSSICVFFWPSICLSIFLISLSFHPPTHSTICLPIHTYTLPLFFICLPFSSFFFLSLFLSSFLHF